MIARLPQGWDVDPMSPEEWTAAIEGADPWVEDVNVRVRNLSTGEVITYGELMARARQESAEKR